MAKKKNSIALFEAISKSKERNSHVGVSVPGWLGKASQSQEPGQPSAENPPPLSGSGSYGGPKIVLSGAGLVLILAVIVAVGAAGFVVGRATAPSKTGKTDTAGLRKAGAALTDGPASSDPMELPVREPKKQYLVIQRIAGMTKNDWKDANDIADWLVRQKGEPCEVKKIWVKNKNDTFLAVWSLKAFDSYQSSSAQEYAKKIESLGKEFEKTDIHKKSTGKYNFSQQHQGKFDPTFVGYNGP